MYFHFYSFIYIFFSFILVPVITPTSPSECYHGDVRLLNNRTTQFQEYIETYGLVEVCVDGRYTPVCSSADLNIPSGYDVICRQLGYYG